MSFRRLRSSRKPKQRRVPTPLWFKKNDLFDAEFDSEDERNAAEVINKRKSRDGRHRKDFGESNEDEDDDEDLKPFNLFSYQHRSTDNTMDSFVPIQVSDSESDIEWLPDLPDDGISLPAYHRRSSYKPRKISRNKRKSWIVLDDTSSDSDICSCSTSTGNTKLICRSCRVPSVTKKPKIDPPKERKDQEVEVITIDCSSETGDSDSDDRGDRHYLDTFSPNSASKLRDYSLPEKRPIIIYTQFSPVSTNVERNDYPISKSGTRCVNANTRNTISVNATSSEGRNVQWFSCPRLPCIVSTSHPSISNPEDNEPERIVSPFGRTKLYALQTCQPDTGEATRKQKLDLVKIARDFCNKKEEPPQELVTSLLNLLREAEDDKLAIKIHRCLLEMIELNPPKREINDLPFDWPMLVDIMEKLNLNMAVFDQFRATSPATTVANTLALDYIVCYLESDLVHRPMGKNKEIHRSAAMFFLKEPEDRLRDVIKYLQLAVISYNEYDQLLIERLCVSESESGYRLPLTDVEKVVPLLQRLLDLFMVICKSPPRDAVDEIVSKLKRVYALCCWEKRQLLLKTLVSPLVKLNFVNWILSTNGAFGDSVPPSFDAVHDIVSLFGKVQPFCTGAADTPPTSPRSLHEENVSGHNDTEEIAMLLYTAITSYIAVVRGNFRRPTHVRFLERDKKHELDMEDFKELRKLGPRINELRASLQVMVGSGMALSCRTTLYLEKMVCIRDVFVNEHHQDDEVIVL